MATPKLRFKDFGEDWTAKKLSQVANLTSSKRVHLSDYVSEGIPFFRGKEITELKSGIFPKDILYISKKQYEDFKEKFGAPQNNEILMTAVGTLANTYLINTDFEFYFKDGNLIWFKDINADPNFLMILLDARKNDVLASAIGSTQKALTIANLNKLIFNFPSNEEQTKIASFLSVVDEKISQLTQKHELLSQYKQGMMQKLFSQQIRFKADDGSEFGEWNKFLLGDCVDILTNGLSLDQNMNGNGFKVTRIETISNFNIDLSRVGYVDTQSDISSYRLVVGDILFSNINSIAHIGKVVYIDKDYDIYHGMNLLRIQFKKNLDKKFMFYELSQKTFKQHFESIANKAVNQASINQTALKKTELCAPCLEEQIKIANFLSAIDQKIEVVAEQIEQAKTWKKGLLQQMFI